MKEKFSTLLILAFVVVFGGCGNSATQAPTSLLDSAASLAAPSGAEASPGFDEIIFPAYELESDENNPYYDIINSTPKFTVTVDLPKGWSIKQTKGDETVPTGELYTQVYIYDNETLIGYIGFNTFEPYTDEIEPENYYKTVYPTLRMSSFFVWDPYTAVKTTHTAETGVVDIWYLDPNEIDKHPGAMPDVPALETTGILSYDKTLKVFIGIAFMPDTVDRAQVETIAQSVSLAALA